MEHIFGIRHSVFQLLKQRTMEYVTSDFRCDFTWIAWMYVYVYVFAWQCIYVQYSCGFNHHHPFDLFSEKKHKSSRSSIAAIIRYAEPVHCEEIAIPQRNLSKQSIHHLLQNVKVFLSAYYENRSQIIEIVISNWCDGKSIHLMIVRFRSVFIIFSLFI